MLKLLGEGGMGTVFLAEHALIKRRVALKLLHPELATDADVVERFMNEARAAGTLGHPNIVESTDMGFTPDRVPYIVFEYLEGALLTDEIYRVGGFAVRRAVRIAVQIASALHAAHAASIVHRDLKSDNVFLTDKDDALDHVKVLDFGISRFLEIDDQDPRREMVMGTPEFMAPEQITAPGQVDRRTDIYALGVILYEMLTARRPFRNEDDPRALLTRIVQTAPPPLARDDVPRGLAEMILHKMLAKTPADRYQSMMDVAAALAGYAAQSERIGLRRSRPITLPVAVGGTAGTELPRRPELMPRHPTQPDPLDLADGAVMPDGSDLLATTVAPRPSARRRPWLLYGIAGAGVIVGAGGLVIGMRSGDPAPIDRTPAARASPSPAPPAIAAPPAQHTVNQVEVQVAANVPAARVTFRGRVLDAPATLRINATNIVELVEVAAAGYKTQRYWLTLDRPTHLTARLVQGDGLSEATEADTLVALGEPAAPAGPPQLVAVMAAPASVPSAAPQPAATPAAGAPPEAGWLPAPADAPPEVGRGSGGVASAAPRPRGPVKPPARRKIGRSAASKPPPPVAAEPVPVPVPAAPEPAAHEPAEPEPAFVKEPAIEPAKPAATSDAELRSMISGHRPDVEHCVAVGRQTDLRLAGSVQLELQIGADGTVSHVQPHATFDAPLVIECIAQAAAGWTFPPRVGDGVATLSVPFTFD